MKRGKGRWEWLPEAELLAYMEAILRVYNAEAERANIYRARIKILVQSLGRDRFIERVEQEYKAIPKDKFRLEPEIVAAIAARFPAPAFETLSEAPPALAEARAGNAEFAAWVERNTHPHKAPGYVSAVISLKPYGGVPGDATDAQMEAVADLADRYSFGEIRVTHIQNLVLPHVRQDELFPLWQGLAAQGLATPNNGFITDIIACPGLDYCALANARSIPVAQRIAERFKSLERQYDIGDIYVNISGCINACGHHHVGHIGILGVDKKGTEFYQVTLGGSAANDAAIGDLVGPAFGYDEITDAVETIVKVYLAERRSGERFIDAYRRLGLAPFKEALYAVA